MEATKLCMLPGQSIQKVIYNKFRSSVSPVSISHALFLVASFGRSKFKLSPSSVGSILQATIGGVSEDFNVVQLADRVFRFSVSSKWVGFHIVNLRSFECSQFKIFFHFWGFGGPNWRREWRLFCLEEDASWSVVRRNSNRATRSVARPTSALASLEVPLSGANCIPIGNRLRQKEQGVEEAPDNARNILNLDSNVERRVSRSQQVPAGNLSLPLQSGICSRCLSWGHARQACKSAFRCYSCLKKGHAVSTCRGGRFWREKEGNSVAKRKDSAQDQSTQAEGQMDRVCHLRPCLVHPENQKVFKIPCHIESFNTCIKH